MYQIDFHKPLHIHFIGIGGISMSGLAEILLGEDFVISGSDSKSSPLTQALEKKGATIYYGQRATNITDDVDVVVYTAAIHPDNPEFACAKEKGLPMLTRAELLGQIMRNYDTLLPFPELMEKQPRHLWYLTFFLQETVTRPSVWEVFFLLSAETSA